ncbi:MAG: CRTAC1 family protein [Planctomycetaceae bacterium]|nr:CRTAC1 family protein [Planctomycetaceae bacterium]
MNTSISEHEDSPEQDDAVIGRALVVSLAVFLAIGTILAIATGVYMVSAAPPAPPAPAQIAIAGKREASVAAIPNVPLTDVTAESGIAYSHTSGAYGEKLLPETMGGGVAVLDYDNDGDADLLFVNSTIWPWKLAAGDAKPTLALYANDGKGKFSDVTKDVGLAISLYGMGAAVGDYDGDGWSDLFLTAVGPNRLLKNEQGKFVDVTEAAGVAGADDAWSTGCTWFDYNRDGRLDLFVCNYVKWSRELDVSQGFTLTGNERAYGPPLSFEGTLCYLYRNDGEGKFSDVSQAAGIQVFNSQQPEKKIPAGKSLGVVPFDLDGDGWQDLVVANDTVQNFVFHNQKDGKFAEIGSQAGIAFGSDGSARGAMGIDIGRPRNSPAVAVVIGNFANEPTSFFVSQGDPRRLVFEDESVSNGLGPQSRLELKFGVFFFDYDLDGRLDVLAANGHLEEEINKVVPSQHYKQPPQLFWNAGAGEATEFVRVPADKVGQQFSQPIVGRGAAYADFDGDGDLDVVLTQCGGTARLFRNDQQLGRHWIRVKLKGRGANPEAQGTILRLHSGGVIQERVVSPTHGYLSQSELTVTFGLGQSSAIDKLEIHWPDGAKQEIAAPKADQLLLISQPDEAQAESDKS